MQTPRAEGLRRQCGSCTRSRGPLVSGDNRVSEQRSGCMLPRLDSTGRTPLRAAGPPKAARPRVGCRTNPSAEGQSSPRAHDKHRYAP